MIRGVSATTPEPWAWGNQRIFRAAQMTAPTVAS